MSNMVNSAGAISFADDKITQVIVFDGAGSGKPVIASTVYAHIGNNALDIHAKTMSIFDLVINRLGKHSINLDFFPNSRLLVCNFLGGGAISGILEEGRYSFLEIRFVNKLEGSDAGNVFDIHFPLVRFEYEVDKGGIIHPTSSIFEGEIIAINNYGLAIPNSEESKLASPIPVTVTFAIKNTVPHWNVKIAGEFPDVPNTEGVTSGSLVEEEFRGICRHLGKLQTALVGKYLRQHINGLIKSIEELREMGDLHCSELTTRRRG